jgi:hypothetical protein
VTDKHGALQTQFVCEQRDVTQMCVDVVVARRRPLAVTVSAKIDGEAAMARTEQQADRVPRASGQSTTVQEDDRKPAAAPIQKVKAHAIDDDVPVLGRLSVLGRKPGYFAKEHQCVGFAH